MNRVMVMIRMDDSLKDAYYKMGAASGGEPNASVVRHLIRAYCVELGLLPDVPQPGARRPAWEVWGANGLTRGIGAQKGIQRGTAGDPQGGGGND